MPVISPKSGCQMVAESKLFQGPWDLGTVGVDLKVIWDMSATGTPTSADVVPLRILALVASLRADRSETIGYADRLVKVHE